MASLGSTQQTAEMDDDALYEDCTECSERQPHEVSIEIRTESTKEENTEFSREPYRVAECEVCGTTTATRMNNV